MHLKSIIVTRYAVIALVLIALLAIPLVTLSINHSRLLPEKTAATSAPISSDSNFDLEEQLLAASLSFNRSRNEESPAGSLTEETSLAQLDELVIPEQAYSAALEPEPVSAALIFTDVNYVLYVAASRLNLRSEPSTESAAIMQLKYGDKVICEGENDQWMKVRYNDQPGFLKVEYTSKTMVFKEVNETVYVKSNTLNLRSGPSADDKVLAELSKNDVLIRTGIGDQWSRVVTASGIKGYVFSSYLTNQPPVNETIADSAADYSNISQEEIDLFTRIVALESSAQYGYMGYLATATVILNRVESPRFANTITGVVSSNNQFSTYTSTRNPQYNDQLRRAIKDALAGKRNLPRYVMYFIESGEYKDNISDGGSFGRLKLYKIAYGTAWCYKLSDR